MFKKPAGIVAFLMITTLVIASPLTSSASIPSTGNETFPSSSQRILSGSGYWTTSNLREWLNGEQNQVTYTNSPPKAPNVDPAYAYDTEAGFLTNFTAAESAAIAVTERREFVTDQSAVEGGTTDTPRNEVYTNKPYIQNFFTNIQNNWQNIRYKATKDKMFILSSHEMYEYAQKRGMPLNKSLSPAAKSLYNISSEYTTSWISALYTTSWGDRIGIVATNNTIASMYPWYSQGVAPAMHVKPGFVFSNGKRADSLALGEIVTFGNYLNSPVRWTVINKTAGGYPLLWATDIITIKAFDAKGDTTYRYSNTDFATADVSIKDNLQYKPNIGTDANEPTLAVENGSDLSVAKTGPWDLTIRATDVGGSGIKSIKLPDGRLVSGGVATFTVPANGYYAFEAFDNSGNMGSVIIPVGNVMPPASVSIVTSKEGWTNSNVTVDISASNAEAGFIAPGPIVNTNRDWMGAEWPDYSSYVGKRVQISGRVRLASFSQTPTETIQIGLAYKLVSQDPNTGIYNINQTWIGSWNKSLSTMTDKQWVNFDVIQTVRSDAFGPVTPWLNTGIWPDKYGVYEVEWDQLKYVLLDQEDFKISSITLPNGQVVNASSYSDTITTAGSYTYKVLDSRGVTTSRTVVVNIDKTLPTLSITGNPTAWTKDDVTLNITTADAGGSDVKRILKPNGEWQAGNALSYNVSQNGSYTFTVEDNAGNQTAQTVTVSKIDKTAPSFTAIPSTTAWTNQNVTVDLSASDAEVGLDYIELPDGSRSYSAITSHSIATNGSYTYKAADKLGQVTLKTVIVSNIDKAIPTVSWSLTEDTTGAITATINALDTGGAAIASIKLDTEVINTSSAVRVVTPGAHELTVRDNAGNEKIITLVAEIPKLTTKQTSNRAAVNWSVSSALAIQKYTLYRDGVQVYEGPALSFDDTLATDKASPGNILDVSFNPTPDGIHIAATEAVDKNTTYVYNLVATTVEGNLSATQKVNQAIVSGVTEYRYSIDKLPTTTTLTETSPTRTFTAPLRSETGYYLHIAALDGAGNTSAVYHEALPANATPVYDVKVVRTLATPLFIPLTSGDPIVWNYTITNASNIEVRNFALTENVSTAISCEKLILAVNESMLCTSSGALTY